MAPRSIGTKPAARANIAPAIAPARTVLRQQQQQGGTTPSAAPISPPTTTGTVMLAWAEGWFMVGLARVGRTGPPRGS